MQPVKEGTMPNEEILEEADMEAAALAAEKAINEMAWKEAMTRQIAIESQNRLQAELKSAVKATAKYEKMVRAGTAETSKLENLRERARKRDQIEIELKKIVRLLSMSNH